MITKNKALDFLSQKKALEKKFGEKIVKKNYYIPINIIVKNYLKYLICYPIESLLYLLVLTYTKSKSLFTQKTSPHWHIAKSSKLIKENYEKK